MHSSLGDWERQQIVVPIKKPKLSLNRSKSLNNLPMKRLKEPVDWMLSKEHSLKTVECLTRADLLIDYAMNCHMVILLTLSSLSEHYRRQEKYLQTPST